MEEQTTNHRTVQIVSMDMAEVTQVRHLIDFSVSISIDTISLLMTTSLCTRQKNNSV